MGSTWSLVLLLGDRRVDCSIPHGACGKKYVVFVMLLVQVWLTTRRDSHSRDLEHGLRGQRCNAVP